MTEQALNDAITALGGRLYICGGWVRDRLRLATPHDKDYIVCGVREGDFAQAFPAATKIGHSFPVYLLTVDGKKCELAFARTERKSARGYRGFNVDFNEHTTIEEDLWRRDTTMNSIAYDITAGRYIDPYNGRADIEGGVIRATSPHFADDPVRALRAARQAAQFGFLIEPLTVQYMRQCRDELLAEPPERLVKELTLALNTDRPSLFFTALRRADLLQPAFPDIYALIGQFQHPQWHPEGDAFVHSLLVLDIVAQERAAPAIRFAALTHDIGKGVTPRQLLPHHYGHEKAGLDVLRDWNRRMSLPKTWLKTAQFVIASHMRVHTIAKPGKITAMITDLMRQNIDIDDYRAVIRADSGGRLPPWLARYEFYAAHFRAISGRSAPPSMTGPQIAAWLHEQRTNCYQTLTASKEGV